MGPDLTIGAIGKRTGVATSALYAPPYWIQPPRLPSDDNGDLVYGSHAVGVGAFPFETVTSGSDPKVAPTAKTFTNNLHDFAEEGR